MPKIIDILLEEHQNIEKLLLVLEHELEIFDSGGRPDYEILQTMIQYFQDYPESCHHPKEEMIFEKLKARDPAAAKRFGDVEAEHEIETRRLHSFGRAVELLSWPTRNSCARAFISPYRTSSGISASICKRRSGCCFPPPPRPCEEKTGPKSTPGSMTARIRCSTAWSKRSFTICKRPSCDGSRRPRKPAPPWCELSPEPARPHRP